MTKVKFSKQKWNGWKEEGKKKKKTTNQPTLGQLKRKKEYGKQK